MGGGLEQLAERITAERDAWSGKRWRCSRVLRADVVAETSARVASGEPVARLARALGVTSVTLTRWLDNARGQSGGVRGFRRVEVDESGHGSQLVVVTPLGYRVEGLDLAGAQELLTVLG